MRQAQHTNDGAFVPFRFAESLLVPSNFDKDAYADWKRSLIKEKECSKGQSVTESPVPKVEPPKAQPPASPVVKVKPKPRTRLVQIFDPELAKKQLKTCLEEHAARQHVLKGCSENDGMRQVSKRSAGLTQRFNKLMQEMPNFCKATQELMRELALAFELPPNDFYVTPILLDGPPGIGKTRFASSVAKAIGVGFEAISLATAQSSAELVGSAAHYTTCRPGRIASLLSSGTDANPVVLLDEIDKVRSDDRYPIIPVLLDLFEKDSASRFFEQALVMPMKAKHVIFICTSNSIEGMSTPLLSRMRVLKIEVPTSGQRASIVRGMAAEYRRIGMTFNEGVLSGLIESDSDLRAVQQALRAAVGDTLLKKSRTVNQLVQMPDKTVAMQRIGF